jgi:hypothetical protein
MAPVNLSACSSLFPRTSAARASNCDAYTAIAAGMSGAAMRLSRIALLVVALSLAASPVAALGFDNAELGMSLAAWRSAAPPTGDEAAARPFCSDDPSASGRQGLPWQPASLARNEVVCTYADLLGRYAMPQTVPLDETFHATGIKYCFTDGRLDEISFTTTVDAFDNVLALVDRELGHTGTMTVGAIRTPLGKMRQVSVRWSAPGGDVQLIDPVKPYTVLQVSFDAAGGIGVSHTAASHDSDRPG